MYQTLNYKVTPETIPDASTLHVDEMNWTITPPLPSGIGHTPQPKQHKKVSFDVQEQLNETIGYEQDEQTYLLCDSLADMSLENRHPVQELIIIFPDIAKKLDASGKLHDWGKALKMIQDNKFPLDNIAHELFLTLSNAGADPGGGMSPSPPPFSKILGIDFYSGFRRNAQYRLL